ncbi:MAG: SDR family oxidoreductase [Hyphomonadaceae bacterium]
MKLESEAPTRVAIVTGAAQGLGLAIATRLAREGMKMFCVDRAEGVKNVAADLRAAGLEAEGAVFDLGSQAAAQAVVKGALDRYGALHVLVNNAGIGVKRMPKIEELAPEEWRGVLDVNLTAPFLLAREAMPLMKKQGWGRIINISSRAGRTAVYGADASYSATKAGIIGLSRLLASEGAKFGVTANAICPGRFDTEMGAVPAGFDIAGAIPVGRVGRPEELGALAAFLASEEAGFITGAVIDINGGAFMG